MRIFSFSRVAFAPRWNLKKETWILSHYLLCMYVCMVFCMCILVYIVWGFDYEDIFLFKGSICSPMIAILCALPTTYTPAISTCHMWKCIITVAGSPASMSGKRVCWQCLCNFWRVAFCLAVGRSVAWRGSCWSPPPLCKDLLLLLLVLLIVLPFYPTVATTATTTTVTYYPLLPLLLI